jgi:anti-repressor protein
MSVSVQNQDPGKPQTFKVITHYGYIPLLVDVDGSRWLHLPPFAEWMGLSLVRDIMPRIDTRPRYWGVRLIGGKQCLPVEKANDFMGILRVEHSKGPMVAWLGNHCTQTLRNFTIPEVQAPMLEVEPEPVPVSFARPAPQFYAPAAPQELITIRAAQIAGSEVNAVDGRELHAFLENGDAFTNWISDRIRQFEFVEHQDYEVSWYSPVNRTTVGSSGGRPTKEYMISIGMAKELAMVERNAKGKQARLYFIECEKKAHAPQNPILTMSRLDLLKMAVESEEKVATLECKVTEQAGTISELRPSAEGYDLIAGSEGSFTITQAAKQLQTSPRKLTIWLTEHKWVYQRTIEAERPEWESQKVWIAFQDKINSGHLISKTFPIYHKDGVQTLPQARITALGLTRLAKHFGTMTIEVAS